MKMRLLKLPGTPLSPILLALATIVSLQLPLGSAALAQDASREVLLRRVTALRSQIHAIDIQIAQLQKSMPEVEQKIDALMERVGSLKFPDPEEEPAEDPKGKPTAVPFRPPVLRSAGKKETPIIPVCQNGRVSIVDLDEMEKGITEALSTKSKVQAFVDARGGTFPAGDFDVKVTLLIFGQQVFLQQQVVPRESLPGETLEEALKSSSRFQQRISKISTTGAGSVIQFAVYPDSFDLFRGLRAEVWQKHGVFWAAMEHGEQLNIGSGGASEM